MKKLFIGIWLFGFSLNLVGQGGFDPIQDYLLHPPPDREFYVKDIQAIRMLELDLNNDGNDDLLLSTDGYGDRTGNYWTVYVRGKEGYFRLSGKENLLQFRDDMFYLGSNDLTNDWALLIRSPGKSGRTLGVIRLKDNTLLRDTVEVSDAEYKEIYENYFEGLSEAKPHRSVVDHPVVVVTKEELIENGYRFENGSVKQQRVIDSRSVETSKTSSATPVAVYKSDVKPIPTPSLESTSSADYPIIPIAIIVVAIAGVIVFLLRRKGP